MVAAAFEAVFENPHAIPPPPARDSEDFMTTDDYRPSNQIRLDDFLDDSF
jgi:hypothetical protein